MGAKIANITKNSPAFRNGIRVGDILVSINDKKIKPPRKGWCYIVASFVYLTSNTSQHI